MNKVLSLVILLLSSVMGFSQVPRGVFVSREDFVKNKPTFEFSGESKMIVRNNKDIVASTGKDKVRFKYNFVYGYSDGKNIYRSYLRQSILPDFGYYKVIYDSGIVIYSREITDFHTQKKIKLFYYSEDRGSPIMRLKRKHYHRKDSENVTINIAALRNKALNPFEILQLDFPQEI
jgi:hypothetical protein